MKKQHLLIALVLYLVSAAISFGAFSYFAPSGVSTGPVTISEEEGEGTLLSALLEIDPNAPKDEVCPLTGKYYTKVEREAWEVRRPLAVMIENHPESRPQSGLSDADIVFEAVAEGGVTRFMAMYLCEVQRFDTTLAPVRSARSYFVDWASGFERPLYVHVGGANLPGPADALGQIVDYGWVGENDLNQFSIGYPTFVRDYNRLDGKQIATEHTMVTTTEKLWAEGVDREWTNMSPDLKIGRKVQEGTNWFDEYESWSFQDSDPEPGSVTSISYDFWSGYNDYSIKWTYDAETNTYKRDMGGKAHADLNNEDQVAASNVVVLLTTEKGPIDEKKHMLYGTTGTGDALIFKNGDVVEATWSKRTRTDELSFTVGSKDVKMARGLTWISVVNNVTEVSY